MIQRSSPLPRLARLCILSVVSVLLVQIAILSLQWRMLQDQPITFYMGYLIDRFGMVPYRDFFDMNTPGVSLVYAWLGRLTEYDDGLIRWVDLGILVLLFRVTTMWMRPFGRLAGWLGTVSFGFIYFFSGPAMSLQREYLLLLPISLAVMVATELTGLSLAWRAALAALCFGCAATVKPHAALGLLPVLLYLSKLGRRERGEGRMRIRDTAAIFGAAGAAFAVPLLLVLGWLAGRGGLGPFLEIVKQYWPIYQDINHDMKVLPADERFTYVFTHMRMLHGLSPWLIMSFVGTYAGLTHAPLRSEQRDRIVMMIQLTACYVIYTWLGGKFWDYHFLPMFFFCALLGGLCFAELPTAASRREGWFLISTVLITLCIAANPPLEYGIQIEGWELPAPKGGRPDIIKTYLEKNMKPGDRVQPLDVTGGAIHGMLLAGARIATPFVCDFHFYHHIHDPYTLTLRQRFIDSMLATRPRFVIQVQTDKPWMSGLETTTLFGELTDLLHEDYKADYEGPGFTIYKRKDEATTGTTAARPKKVTVRVPGEGKPRKAAIERSKL